MASLTCSTEAHVQGKYSAEKQEYLLRKQDTETFQSRLETLHISSGEAIDSVLEGKAKKTEMTIIIYTSFLLFRADCRANSSLLKGLTIHKNIHSSI